MSGWLRDPWQAWRDFLFVRGELYTLALFRIGWACAMLIETYQDWSRSALYAPGHYHLALIAWAQPVTPQTYTALMSISALGCGLTLLGVLPRAGALAVVAAQGYLFASDLLLFRNHIYLGLLLGLLLAAAPSARALSLEALLGRLRGRPLCAQGSRAVVQLIKVQVLIVYAYSALNKLRPSFLDGFTLQQELPYAMRASVLHGLFVLPGGGLRPPVARLLESDTTLALCALLVVLIEAFLSLGLWQRRLYRAAIALGLALHGAIFLCMDVLTFGLMMIATYPLFLHRNEG